MCESEYSCQRSTTIPWNWSYRDCELTKTAFCYSRALFLLSRSSPAPLTLKPAPHRSTSLYSTESKLLATLLLLLPILSLSQDSRPSTFLSSFHPNDSRLMTYWPTFTISSLVLLNSSTWASISHWLSVLCTPYLASSCSEINAWVWATYNTL